MYMVLSLQLKDADWMSRLKNKLELTAVYKNLTSLAKTHRLNVKDGKMIAHASGI
jgi:hypothetical protein